MNDALSPWRLSVAPMLDWTDRHCRYFHRKISRRARLYTEMVTTGALLHGDVERHLGFDAAEHPVALQLGGSEPRDLAACAKLAEQWGYDEVNLNCGCPSERVQRGAFGACLMAEPALVADGVKAMRDAVSIPVTVKHRIGIDKVESYSFVRDFVGTVAQAGGEVFIVHARNAWLKGLSPRENREVPPLRYEAVHQLKKEFPSLTICINGGFVDDTQIERELGQVDGVMIGREAYHRPWMMASWDERFLALEAERRSSGHPASGHAPVVASELTADLASGPTQEPTQEPTREAVEETMVRYMERHVASGGQWPQVARHMLGLWNGLPGARRWRQVLSDHKLKTLSPAAVMKLADDARRQSAASVATSVADG